MSRSVTLNLDKPSFASRLWYRRLGEEPPKSETQNWLVEWARLVPYRFRRFHRSFADVAGYFWIPCVLCDRPFGGHEWGSSIPDPFRPPFGGVAVCSQCTIRRNRKAKHDS